MAKTNVETSVFTLWVVIRLSTSSGVTALTGESSSKACPPRRRPGHVGWGCVMECQHTVERLPWYCIIEAWKYGYVLTGEAPQKTLQTPGVGEKVVDGVARSLGGCWMIAGQPGDGRLVVLCCVVLWS